MQSQQRLAQAAVEELTRRLSGQGGRGGGRTGGPRVAETAVQGPDTDSEAPDLGPLQDLARAVVEAVLALADQDLAGEDLAGEVARAVTEQVSRRSLRDQTLAARLRAEIPRLIDLPRLAALARAGIRLGPAAAAAVGQGDEIVGGRSPGFAQVLEDLERVAATDFPVLLTGETGTGKELLARRLHALSSRSQGPLVAVNCAAMAKGLLEAELFGHRRGAFTGAGGERLGYIRAADGGTLFLDEIAETTPEFQVRLLRVLEERVVVPVGGHQGVAVDFRLVTASHCDLEAMAEAGRFNPALLYRILVVPLHLPPLRERREDLPALIDHFLAQACLLAKRTRGLTPEARRLLLAYDWPGNARQLSHVLQQMVALAPEYAMEPRLLPPEVRGGAEADLRDRFARRLEGVAGLPPRRGPELAALLAASRGGDLYNKDVREHLGCSDSTAKNILRALVQAGVVEARGDRGGRRYRALEPDKE